jgi:hypothetical protein
MCVCEREVRRNSAYRKISYLRSLSMKVSSAADSVLFFSAF